MGLLEISAHCWDLCVHIAGWQIPPRSAHTTDMTTSDQRPPAAPATSSELNAQVACWETEPGVSHAYMLSDVGLWYSERRLFVMDLKPARSQDLWWCECVGVHLLQTRRAVWGREAGAFKSELSQKTRDREENREDCKTIPSQTMTHCKDFAVVSAEIQNLPCGGFHKLHLLLHELWATAYLQALVQLQLSSWIAASATGLGLFLWQRRHNIVLWKVSRSNTQRSRMEEFEHHCTSLGRGTPH